MLKKIIDRLREELAPLVRAELRASLENPVRQELRQELLAAGLHDSTNAGSKQKIEAPSASPELPGLIASLASEISAKMEQSMNLQLAELRGTLREELAPQIQEELKTQIRAELHEEVESEKRRLVDEATHQTLLEYLLKKKWDGIEAFLEGIPLRMRLEAKSVLREALKPEVWDLMLNELRAQVKEDENHPICRKIEDEIRADNFFRANVADRLRDGILAQMRDDPQHPMHQTVSAHLRNSLHKTVAASLKHELAPVVRNELHESLKPEVREALESQMLKPVLLGMDGNLEGTVAGVLRKNLSVCVSDLRNTILDEIWELATTAIMESLGAALMPADLDGEPLLDRAHQAAMEVFQPKNARARLSLESAVTAALNVIIPGYSDDAEERSLRFTRMAQELIDDRLIPSSFKSSRKLGIPEGFFRAVKTHTCDVTKNIIQPGDFYVAVRGLRIALPVSQETAEELVSRSAANEIPTDNVAIEPPWKGIPFTP